MLAGGESREHALIGAVLMSFFAAGFDTVSRTGHFGPNDTLLSPEIVFFFFHVDVFKSPLK